MILATLVLPIEQGHVWLGKKQTGEIGQSTWNAPGGKVKKGESVTLCAIRELHEEMGLLITPDRLAHVATIDFHAGDIIDFAVEVFRVTEFTGKPRPTREMNPVARYPFDSLPFDAMLASDRDWFTRAVTGKPFRAEVFYRGRATGYLRTEFHPYRSFKE